MSRLFVDISMTVLLLLSMSYETVGYAFIEFCEKNFGLMIDNENFAPIVHECFGFALIALFFYHLWLNRFWLKNIFRGKYDTSRFVIALTNIILIIDVIFLLLSGMMMSRIFFSEEIYEGMSFARTSHMLASYWGYVIMSFHTGLYWDTMKSMMFRNNKNFLKSTIYKICSNFIGLILIVYGIFAFVKRQLGEYMFLISDFVFFDFEEPIIYFFIDYLAIMIMCACVGHYLNLFLRRQKNA